LRIAFTSDLHTDHHPELVDLIADRVAGAADVLIVAGDVSPSMANLIEVLQKLRDAVPVLAFVPGNHDLWCAPGTADSRARYLDIFPAICQAMDVAYLPAGPVHLGGATLVGQTGWYDYSLRDPALDAEVPLEAYARGALGPLTWADKQYVIWPGCDDRALTRLMSARLAADLEAVPRGKPVWVVTHMLPFVELVARRPLPWGFVNGFLGATSLGSTIVAAAEAGVPVARAVSGHTHFRRSAAIGAGERRFTAETSPIGYPREVQRQAASLAEHVAERVRIVDEPG
jgi:predicted phosphohydrolase